MELRQSKSNGDILFVLRKIILLGLFIFSLLTLFLTWENIVNVRILDGIVVLTANKLLSGMIICMYFVSVLFFEKAPKTMFCVGLSALSMLFGLYLSKFESFGGFSNRCIGPYLSLISVAITIAIYLILTNIALQKDEKGEIQKKN